MDVGEGEVVRVAPKMQLPRAALLGLFAVVIGAGLGRLRDCFLDSVGGPPLPVEVSLDKAPVDANVANLSILTDVIRITNPGTPSDRQPLG